MFKSFEFCLPTASKAGADWLHEVRYDGYGLRVERAGSRVRLITRNGHDWTKRYPWIVEAALKNRSKQFVIDGEAVVLGVDGISDFNALHSRKSDAEVQLYAFDLMALDGEDLRARPLDMRKTHLARLLRGRPTGIFIAPFELGAIGPDLFDATVRMGLEGIVSKRRDRRYAAGRSKEWVKVKTGPPGDDAANGGIQRGCLKQRATEQIRRNTRNGLRGIRKRLRIGGDRIRINCSIAPRSIYLTSALRAEISRTLTLREPIFRAPF